MVANGALLIDVREQKEWYQSRIPEADFKPLSQVSSWCVDLSEIIFYCRSDNRSGQLVATLADQAGMMNVHNMAGGIVAWVRTEWTVRA